MLFSRNVDINNEYVVNLWNYSDENSNQLVYTGNSSLPVYNKVIDSLYRCFNCVMRDCLQSTYLSFSSNF